MRYLCFPSSSDKWFKCIIKDDIELISLMVSHHTGTFNAEGLAGIH